MTDEQESRKSDEKKHKGNHHHGSPKAYASVTLDRCQEEWRVTGVFMCKCDAIEYCVEAIRDAARCNKPIEWWRVVEYRLDCGDICWGPYEVNPGVYC